MKNISTLLLTVFIVSCASTSTMTMPESRYEAFSLFTVGLQKCFENEEMSPQLYANTKEAFSYVLSTWNYDRSKFLFMMDEKSQIKVTSKDCREVKAEAYRIISKVGERKIKNKEDRQALNNALKDFSDSMERQRNSYRSTTTDCYKQFGGGVRCNSTSY